MIIKGLYSNKNLGAGKMTSELVDLFGSNPVDPVPVVVEQGYRKGYIWIDIGSDAIHAKGSISNEEASRAMEILANLVALTRLQRSLQDESIVEGSRWHTIAEITKNNRHEPLEIDLLTCSSEVASSLLRLREANLGVSLEKSSVNFITPSGVFEARYGEGQERTLLDLVDRGIIAEEDAFALSDAVLKTYPLYVSEVHKSKGRNFRFIE